MLTYVSISAVLGLLQVGFVYWQRMCPPRSCSSACDPITCPRLARQAGRNLLFQLCARLITMGSQGVRSRLFRTMIVQVSPACPAWLSVPSCPAAP